MPDINSTYIYLHEHEKNKNKKFVEFRKEKEEKYFIHKKLKILIKIDLIEIFTEILKNIKEIVTIVVKRSTKI